MFLCQELDFSRAKAEALKTFCSRHGLDIGMSIKTAHRKSAARFTALVCSLSVSMVTFHIRWLVVNCHITVWILYKSVLARCVDVTGPLQGAPELATDA